VRNLSGVGPLAFSPDGEDLIATTENTAAGLSFLHRDAAGRLTQTAGLDGCVTSDGRSINPSVDNSCRSVSAATGIGRAGFVNGNQFYAAFLGSSAVVAFKRDFLPRCADQSLTVAADTAFAVPFACSDRNGDALSFTILGQPTAGQLGAVDNPGARVFYNPFGGFSGTDSFRYRASAGGRISNTVTATLTVVPGPAPFAGVDADRDGFFAGQDCNDANAAIRPGATDVPDNGVDENCDGVDATNLDRDRDGVPRPQDCNDANAAIRPGATEIIGNDVDENCDGLVAPYPPLTGSVSGTWQQVGKGTRNLTLVAKGFPFRTVITLRCTGSPACPKTIKKTVGRDRRAVNLHAALGRRTLSKKARITLSITRASRIGRELRYSLATPGLPDMEFLCRPPGGSAGPC
jgi:Big-like domain-containing protein/putative metal-binding protein